MFCSFPIYSLFLVSLSMATAANSGRWIAGFLGKRMGRPFTENTAAWINYFCRLN